MKYDLSISRCQQVGTDVAIEKERKILIDRRFWLSENIKDLERMWLIVDLAVASLKRIRKEALSTIFDNQCNKY